MLISDEHAFIFVHIEKTAGTSMAAALAAYALPKPASFSASVLKHFGLPRGYQNYKFSLHASLADAEARIPAERFERYTKFAFVRNPWDRLVSEYNAAIKKNRRARHKKIAAMADFSDYIDYEIARDKLYQLPRCLNKDGEMALDFVGKFEQLNDDFAQLCAQLGIQETLPKLNAYAHEDYRGYYNDASIEKVAQHWAQDIAAFDYTF